MVTVALGQQMVEQARLARAEKAGQHGDRNRFFLFHCRNSAKIFATNRRIFDLQPSRTQRNLGFLFRRSASNVGVWHWCEYSWTATAFCITGRNWRRANRVI